jgi:hypothetical protein
VTRDHYLGSIQRSMPPIKNDTGWAQSLPKVKLEPPRHFDEGTAMPTKKNAGAKSFGKQLTDDPDDAPELLFDFFRHGELRHDGRLIRRGGCRYPASRKPR